MGRKQGRLHIFVCFLLTPAVGKRNREKSYGLPMVGTFLHLQGDFTRRKTEEVWEASKKSSRSFENQGVLVREVIGRQQTVTFRTQITSHLPRVVTREVNSPTVADAGRKRRIKWVPGAWGYNWDRPTPGGYKYDGSDPPGWGLGNRPATCHCNTSYLLGDLKSGLGTVRLSGIDLGRGNGLMR